MKTIILIISILLPVSSFCQSTDSLHPANDSLKNKNLEIGVTVSPDYSFRTLKPDADSKWIAESRDSLEIPKLGYTVGVNAELKLNQNLHASVGLLFSDSGERTKKYSLESVPAGQKAIEYSYNFHYYYLNIPVQADYYLLTGKLKLFVTAGISANIFLTQRTTSITSFGNNDSRITTTINSGFSRLNLAVLGGCGVKYPINKKTNLLIEPIYRRSITSIINAPVKSYLFSGGLILGVYCNI